MTTQATHDLADTSGKEPRGKMSFEGKMILAAAVALFGLFLYYSNEAYKEHRAARVPQAEQRAERTVAHLGTRLGVLSEDATYVSEKEAVNNATMAEVVTACESARESVLRHLETPYSAAYHPVLRSTLKECAGLAALFTAKNLRVGDLRAAADRLRDERLDTYTRVNKENVDRARAEEKAAQAAAVARAGSMANWVAPAPSK